MSAKDTVTLEVKLTKEEYKDLEEFVKHHPKRAKTPAEALKVMAGTKMYRTMKQAVDPKRQKSPVQIPVQELGIPTFIPCAVDQLLKKRKISYKKFLTVILAKGLEIFDLAMKGDKEAQKAVKQASRDYGVLVVFKDRKGVVVE